MTSATVTFRRAARSLTTISSGILTCSGAILDGRLFARACLAQRSARGGRGIPALADLLLPPRASCIRSDTKGVQLIVVLDRSTVVMRVSTTRVWRRGCLSARRRPWASARGRSPAPENAHAERSRLKSPLSRSPGRPPVQGCPPRLAGRSPKGFDRMRRAIPRRDADRCGGAIPKGR